MMNRRDFLKSCAISAGVVSFSGCAVSKTSQSTVQNLPNVVIIYADDMGYGDLACQNPQSKIPTPNLDKLAGQGVRFTDGHSSSGICTPSRYSLLTGRHHWRDFHGIVGSFGQPRFKENQLTLPEMLKTKGYRTACIGKWHLGWDWNAIKQPGVGDKKTYEPADFDWSKPIPGGPTDHGFDDYFGDGTINFPPYAWVENDRMPVAPTEPLSLSNLKTQEGSWEFRPGPMVKDWNPYKVLPTLTEKTVDWIGRQNKKQPFFLYFALPSPHAPIIPDTAFQGKTEAGGYGDYMFQTDWSAGQILRALDKQGLADNTIVIFTSDNGPEKYAFERTRRYGHRSMGQLRGLKRDIWEGGHRVPFVVRWPGVIKPGRVNDALISQVDLMATIAGIVDYPLPDNSAEDSCDQLPAWKDNTDKTAVRTSHVHNTAANKYAIRKDNWVLIDYKTGSMSEMPDWYIQDNQYDTDMPKGGLYNLNEDVGQHKNYINEYPEKAAELRKLLKSIRDKGHSAPRLER